MPHAIAIAHGLDWDTEIRAFWSWLEDAREVLEKDGAPHSLVQELIAGQREKIEQFASTYPDPEASKRILTIAVALVGCQYSSMQKLIAALRDQGVFEPPRERPVFDTFR